MRSDGALGRVGRGRFGRAPEAGPATAPEAGLATAPEPGRAVVSASASGLGAAAVFGFSRSFGTRTVAGVGAWLRTCRGVWSAVSARAPDSAPDRAAAAGVVVGMPGASASRA